MPLPSQSDYKGSGNIAFLLLGGNQGDVLENFKAVQGMLVKDNMQILNLSPIYKTQSWGFHATSDFFNQVIKVSTQLSPDLLLKWVLDAEEKLGRIREGNRYSSRSMDIDILFYENFVLNSKDLIIPHPRLHLRNFTLVPLNDIAPDWQHPVLKKSVNELLHLSKDELRVTLYQT